MRYVQYCVGVHVCVCVCVCVRVYACMMHKHSVLESPSTPCHTQALYNSLIISVNNLTIVQLIEGILVTYNEQINIKADDTMDMIEVNVKCNVCEYVRECNPSPLKITTQLTASS